MNSFIITHKDDATTNLFNMSKLFQEKNPVKPLLKNSNAKELIFENPTKNKREKERLPGLKSKIKCATAGGKGVGRSDTLTNVHASELAFWPGEIAETYSGLMQAVPATKDSMVIIESTAKGFNFFKEMWDDAVAGRNDYVPFFAAWFEMDEYRRDYHGGAADGGRRSTQDRFWLGQRAADVAEVVHPEQLQQRHGSIPPRIPISTPEEAFIATGAGVFDNRCNHHTAADDGGSTQKGTIYLCGNTGAA